MGRAAQGGGLWRVRGPTSFATGNGLASLTAPMILNLVPVGANLASTGEVILWGYLCDPMSLREKAAWQRHPRGGCDS